MKKIMSLLLAIAMLLSLSGVAVAATGGQLQEGNNTIELPWNSKTASVYTYTATQTGTLYIAATEFYYADGDENYIDNTDNWDEWAWYTELTVNGQTLESDYYGTVEVVEGQTYTFSWKHIVDAKWYTLGWKAVLNLSYTNEAFPKPGSETLPVELYRENCPTESIEIPAGSTAYYLLMDFAGASFTVTGEQVWAEFQTWGTEPAEPKPVTGEFTLEVEYDNMTLQITNMGTEPAVFALDYYYPLGSAKNPDQLVMGENVAVTEKDNWDGYFFTWTAACNGTLTLTYPDKGWMSSVRNVTAEGVEEWYDWGYGTAVTVAVSAGDVILISVNSFNGMMVPGGDVIFSASVTYDHDYVDGVCQHCGGEEVLYELGDVNGDGKINARDARLLLRYAAGLVGSHEIVLDAADYNGDGKINARDARAVLRFAAGLA